MDWGSIIQAGISLYGSMQSNKKEGKSMDAYQRGLDLLQSIVPPTLQDLSIELQRYVEQGQISPEEYVAYMLEQSEAEGIQIPEEIKNIQYETLHQLNDIATNGGLTDIDRAQLENIKSEMATTARGKQLATQQNFAARGLSGSGLEIASQLRADSDAIQAAAKGGYDVAAEAQKRAYQALRDSNSAAGNMRTQEFQEQKAKADAADAVARYNNTLRNTVANRNVEESNTAQRQNLANRQRIADMNTGLTNEEERAGANARQQQFNNEVARAGGIVRQGNQIGDQYLSQAARDENQYAAIGSAIGDIFDTDDDKDDDDDKNKSQSNFDSASGWLNSGSWTSDERAKTDIGEVSDDQLDEIFHGLTANKYRYQKGYKKQPQGVTVGIMAQDMERTPQGAALVVEQDDGFKGIDKDKALQLALAGLSSQSKRLRRLEGR